MRSLSKLLGMLLLGLLALLAIAIIALTQLLDPNDYKNEIRSLVQEHTGYVLQIDGDIGWSLFPWLGLELADTRIARLDMPEQPFADVRLLALSVEVLPLLRKEIRMSDIRLDGLDLKLVRTAGGDSNWEVPAEDLPDSTTQPLPEPEEEADDKPAANIKLEINSLIVNSARVEYHDEKTGQRLTLESVQISAGAIGERRNTPVKISGFLASSKPLLRARMEMSASAWMDQANKEYRLEGFKLVGEVAGEPLNNKSANISLSGNLTLAQQQLDWQQLRFSANQLKGMGELQIAQLDATPALSGKLSLAAFSLREFLPGIGVELPTMQNKTALGHVELTADLQGTHNSLLLTNARLKLDNTSLHGNLGLSNLAQGTLLLKLTGDNFNLDDYLPPASAPAKTSAGTGGTGSDSLPAAPTDNPWDDSELLPVKQLADLNLDLELALDRLTVSRLPLDSPHINLSARNGTLNLKQFQTGLYGGNLAFSGQLDSQASPPQLNLHSTVSAVPVDKLMTTLTGSSPVSGLLQLDSQLTTSGNSQRQWVSQLDGKANFELVDGSLPDTNLEQQLCLAIATLNRKTMSQDYSRSNTPFTQLKGSARLNKGTANTPDLRIAIPGLQVNGKGDLDLNHMGLDYRLDIILQGDTRAMPDPACTINPRYVGIEWPIRCRGPLAQAGQSCRIDQDGLGKVAARLAGNKITEKLEQELKDKVSPDLKEALKGLFK